MPRGIYPRNHLRPQSHADAAAALRTFADELEAAAHNGSDPGDLGRRGLRLMQQVRRFLLGGRWTASSSSVTAFQHGSGAQGGIQDQPEPDSGPGSAEESP